jgi:putative ABC transport system ATP-binding protein
VTAVQLSGVERQYRTGAGVVRAVNGVSLEVEAGTNVAIMGPSGCGKSTLLGLVGGLEEPTAGTIRVLGQDLDRMGDEARAAYRRRHVGFIFQAYDLLPFLTVYENVALQAGISDAEKPQDPAELLSGMGILDQQDKFPDQLSGGQKQRVGIARCLVHRPGIVLADEPTGGLDSVTSESVILSLLETARSIAATMLVVTHDARVASHFDRVITLRDGAIV